MAETEPWNTRPNNIAAQNDHPSIKRVRFNSTSEDGRSIQSSPKRRRITDEEMDGPSHSEKLKLLAEQCEIGIQKRMNNIVTVNNM